MTNDMTSDQNTEELQMVTVHDVECVLFSHRNAASLISILVKLRVNVFMGQTALKIPIFFDLRNFHFHYFCVYMINANQV